MKNINISTITVGALQTNCYIVEHSKTKEALLLDPGAETSKIKEYLQHKNITAKAILLTHGHFDHIMAATELSKEFGISIYASEIEAEVCENVNLNLSGMFGEAFTLSPDKLLKDGDIITIAHMSFKVIHTPGHTKGSICFYMQEESVLFSGDTLFQLSCGRTDFPTGNASQLLFSIKDKLFTLPENTLVYSGHGSVTNIGYEKQNNPYVNEDIW